MSEEARYKMLKNAYNSSSTGAIVLEDNEISIKAGLSSLNVNETGIDIQPDINGHISLSSFNIKQPLSKASNIPMDFVPGSFNWTPRKTFDLPIINQMAEVSNVLTTLGVLLS